MRIFNTIISIKIFNHKIGNPIAPPEIRTIFEFTAVNANSYVCLMLTPDPLAVFIPSTPAEVKGKVVALPAPGLFAAMAKEVA